MPSLANGIAMLAARFLYRFESRALHQVGQ
jgi:hypothetical protein